MGFDTPVFDGGATARERRGEQGYLLLGLLFLVALMSLALAVAAPKIGRDIQREKELETIHRGEQYKRAIQLYYRKFGTYPVSINQLKETNQIRFLRKEYVDPMTGKKDWKLLHLGEVQMQAIGLFGKPMTTAGAGIVSAANMQGAGGVQGVGGAGAGAGSAFGGNSVNGSSVNGSSSDDGFFNDNNSSSSSGSAGSTGSAGPAGAAGAGAGAGNPSVGPGSSDAASQMEQSSGGFGDSSSSGAGSAFGSSSFGQDGAGGQSGFGGPGGMNGQQGPGGVVGTGVGINGAQNGAGGTGNSPVGGGAPIVGVTVPLKKKSIITYRKKTEYDKWQFVYNPAEELNSAMGLGTGGDGTNAGTPAGAMQNGGFGQPDAGQSGAFGGQSNGSSGFGSSSSDGFGSPSSSGFNNGPNSGGFGSSPSQSPEQSNPMGGSSPQ